MFCFYTETTVNAIFPTISITLKLKVERRFARPMAEFEKFTADVSRKDMQMNAFHLKDGSPQT